MSLNNFMSGGVSTDPMFVGATEAVESHGASLEFRKFVEDSSIQSTSAHEAASAIGRDEFYSIDSYPVWVVKLWNGDAEGAYYNVNATTNDGAKVEMVLTEVFPNDIDEIDY